MTENDFNDEGNEIFDNKRGVVLFDNKFVQSTHFLNAVQILAGPLLHLFPALEHRGRRGTLPEKQEFYVKNCQKNRVAQIILLKTH